MVHPAGPARWEPWRFYAVLIVTVVALAWVGPVLTNDGPAHVAMVHFMLHARDASLPMLARLYELNPYPSPNLGGHGLLAVLMAVLPPLTAENVLQLICVASVPLAARLLLGRIALEARWLAVFFIPVGLQRMFFLGLYNFCLSVTGFLLCLWAYLRLRQSHRWLDAALLGALLLLTLACHAGGWSEAGLAIAVLLLTEAALRWRTGAGWDSLPRVALLTAAAAVPSVLAVGLHTLRLAGLGGMGGAVYTFNPLQRLWAIAKGDPFATIGLVTPAVAVAFNLVLLALCVWGWQRRGAHTTSAGPSAASATSFASATSATPATPATSPGQSPALSPALSQALFWALPATLLLFALLVPDKGGGGWTHDWRAAAFPYIGLLLAVAVVAVALPPALRTAAGWVGAVGSLAIVAATVDVQARHVPPMLAAFDRIAALIPPHCSVAPVFTNFKLDAANTARLAHHPLFQLSTRIGLSGDRPVLFNYLARLAVYPVRFRDGADPHALLYGWQPMQSATLVQQIDVPAYEQSGLLTVDFVLLHDVPARPVDGAYRTLRQRLQADFRPVARNDASGLERLGRSGGARPARAALHRRHASRLDQLGLHPLGAGHVRL